MNPVVVNKHVTSGYHFIWMYPIAVTRTTTRGYHFTMVAPVVVPSNHTILGITFNLSHIKKIKRLVYACILLYCQNTYVQFKLILIY